MIKYILPLFLVGCATTEECTTIQVKEVYIPTYAPAKPVDVVRPKMSSTVNMTDDQSVKSLKIDMTLINKYVDDLERVLGVYKEEK